MRLIDADALIAQMKADTEQMKDPIAQMFAYGAINDVKRAPTITRWIPCSERLPEKYEKVLVTVSEWKYESDCGITKCKECGWSIEEYIEYNFCPNCGAHMKGADDE